MTDITAGYHNGDLQSVAANASITGDKARIRAEVLAYLRATGDRGATCDEIEQAMLLSHQTCSPRCTELRALGLVYCDGTRPTRTGRQAAVLKVVP